MSTPVKVDANRRNAESSSGPRTDEGKAIVATNALQHGLLSCKPVVAAFEREEDWDAHHEMTLLDLRPEGRLETVLAERVALLQWRLGRVAPFEVEAISTAVEDAEGAWTQSLGRSSSPLKKLGKEISALRLKLDLLKHLPKAAEDELLNTKLVAFVIDAAAKVARVGIYSGRPDGPTVEFPDYPDGAELDEVEWTGSRARGALEAIAEGGQRTMQDLLNALAAGIRDDLAEKQVEYENHRADLERFRRRMLLPDEETMEQVRRYETTLERAMFRCLHELQRLQAARKGQVVPAPLAVDVNISGNSE